MGFFDFLKKSPAQQEPSKILEFSPKELHAFLQESISAEKKSLEHIIKHHSSELSRLSTDLKEKLAVLEKAEPKNKEIPDRVRHILEGNQKIFFQRTETLLGRLKLPQDPVEIHEFASDFDKFMTDFDKGIAKSHEVVAQFFPKETGAISEVIRSIDKEIKEASRSVISSKIFKIKEIISLAADMDSALSGKSDLLSKAHSIEEQLKEKSKDIEKKNKALTILQQSKEHEELKQKIKEHNLLEADMKKCESQVSHSFSEIESALRKYANMSENPTAKKYLDNPIEALFKDKDLDIINVLDSAKRAIESGELILKDKKRDKVIKELAHMDRDFFEGILATYEKFSTALSRLDEEISSAQIVKDIDRTEQDIRSDSEKLAELNLELSHAQKALEGSDVKSLISQIENKTSETLGKNVQVVL